jgi:hypothetical protein
MLAPYRQARNAQQAVVDVKDTPDEASAALPGLTISNVISATARAIKPISGGPILVPLKHREERGCESVLRYEILCA